MSKKIINQLLSIRGLNIECPNCQDEFSVKRGKLFGMYDKYPAMVQKIIKERLEEAYLLKEDVKMRKKALAKNKKKKPEKITISAQASNFGQISEQILPAFLAFPYKQSDCRILFKPIDYVVFSNLSQNGRVENIKFVDVKTGGGRLDKRQKQIRDRIEEGEIKHRIIE
jgi:predicted Holliday junction resolvase-like endonuclease